MMHTNNHLKPHLKLYQKFMVLALLLIFFTVNLMFLVDFPFVHSDEAWLSGLSRTVMEEQSFSVKVPFFDLYPTTVHAMKVVFVALQMLFIQFFGYSISSVRLLSLVFSTLSLYIFFKILFKYSREFYSALLFTLLFAVNIQFLVSAHMARQEAVLLFLMLLAFYVLLDESMNHQTLVLALIIGIAVGIHPNSFFLAIGVGLIYLYRYFKKNISFKELSQLVIFVSLLTLLYIVVTFNMNADFVSQYTGYGETLGVGATILDKLSGFYYFIFKLFFQIGGTYYLPDIKLDFLLLTAAVFLGAGLVMTKDRSNHRLERLNLGEPGNEYYPLFMFLGIASGILIVGRYNQTSIIFLLPFVYIGLFVSINILLDRFQELHKADILRLAALLLVVAQCFNTYGNLKPIDHQPYEEVLEELAGAVPKDAKVLANLNLDYYFDNGSLYDYRNLMYLEKNNLDFEGYIQKNAIEYIIVHEEMDYIVETSPKWDILYGELTYYDDMNLFLETRCTLIHEFENPTYAMRIAKYVDDYPWYTKIYKVN